MVANDICYHKPCMDNFRAQKVPTGRPVHQNLYDLAFTRLVEQLDTALFHEMSGFFITSLRSNTELS